MKKYLCGFAVLIFLSQDYWNWQQRANIVILGLPSVVVYFFVLQLFLALAIWGFSRQYWQE